VTTILNVVGFFAIIAGSIWLVFRLERASRQRIERRREVWRAGGCVGPEPGLQWRAEAAAHRQLHRRACKRR
jgi:hypothetical protein